MMSKLSGILPANSRLLSADTSKAQPTRAGAPKFWGGPDVMEGSPKSILATSALDRVSWSASGKQGMNDAAVPLRPDELQNLPGDGLVDFSSGSASFPGTTPVGAPGMTSPADEISFSPTNGPSISDIESIKPMSTGRIDFFA